MKYNFDKMTNRRDTNSLKWDIQDNELPMWVADMDFEIAPEIKEALYQRVEHGIFGYNNVPYDFFASISNWWETYHHFEMNEEWMMFCTGVVPAISSIVRKLTKIGDNILILSPVYNIFYNSILNNERYVLPSNLVYNGIEYSIDFNDLEKKLSEPKTTMMIFCNPHNPIGKIWDKETLEKVGDLCNKYHVLILSDEIHCDIVEPGYEYIPFLSVSEQIKNNIITCIAPTKAFNLAGLQCACIVVPNKELRDKVNRGINTDEVAEPNSFACLASIAAFEKGKKWLSELNIYIQRNREIAMQYIEKQIPSLHIVSSHATYLLWIDCTDIAEDSKMLTYFIREYTGLYVTNGEEYGDNGKGFIRINIACPQVRLMDGLERLKNGITLYQQSY